MNVLEQLQALGFREEPYRFDTGGGTFDGYAGVDTGGPGLGPGGTELSSEISSTAGGTGRGTVSIAGPVSPESPEVLASYAAGRLSNFNWDSPQGKEAASILAQLDAMGYGKMEGANPNNPTQTVENLLAVNTANSLVPLALSFMPGMGLARGLQTGAQLVADLSSGKLSPADVIADLGLTLASAFTGQSKGTLAAAARGDFGTAAMSAAKGAITSALAQHTGAPASIVGAGVNAVFSGIGSGAGKAGAPGGGGTDVAGGPADMAPGGTDTASLGGDASPSFDLGNLGPLFTVAALEDILTPKEKDEQEQEQARSTLVSPFGSMPYA